MMAALTGMTTERKTAMSRRKARTMTPAMTQKSRDDR